MWRCRYEERSSAVSDGFTGSWLRLHVEKGSVVSDASTGRSRPRLRGNLRAVLSVLFLFFFRVTRTCVRMHCVASARCLGKRCVLSRLQRDCWMEC